MKSGISNIFRDIRFWIILYFLVRLFGITNPPLEVGHNWRQTTVNMVARNFLEVDNNILYPRIDIAGEKTGITGMEFPILNYLIYMISELFGYDHWYGRLINLVISSAGVLYFYKTILRFFDRRTALYSGIILLSSIWFAFSRKIMPDTFAVSIVLMALFYGLRYLYPLEDRDRVINLFAFVLFGTIGVLSKLPSGFLLAVLLIPFIDKAVSKSKKIKLLLAIFILLCPVYWWYFHWVPHLVEEYGFWHFFMGSSLSQGLAEIIAHLSETMSRFYDDALKFIGFTAFVGGLVYAILKKETRLLAIFTFSFLAFAVIILKAGLTFYHHNYYIIPFVPIMALVAGYGISKIKLTWIATTLLLAIAVEGVINQQHDFRIKDKELALLDLEGDLDAFTSKNELILINSGDYPTPLYFAHRKGWVASNENILRAGFVDSLEIKGLSAIVILKRSFGHEIPISNAAVLENEFYSIYKND